MRLVPFAFLLVSATVIAAPALKDRPPLALAVACNKSGNWDIYLVQPGNAEPKQLTKDAGQDTEPSWSPDGKRIAFLSDRDGEPNIWLMNADGSEQKALTQKTGGCSNPVWSPDGSRIVYVSRKAGVDQLFLVEVASGKISQLTNTPTANRQPAWSPDGKKLSYTSYAGRYGTYTINVDGTDNKRLTDQNGGVDASWSPDGKKLTFVSMNAADGGWRVFTIDADGNNLKQITTNSNTYGNVFPRWSPDGKKISYSDLVEGNLQVAVVPSDGGQPKIVTSKPLNAFTRWSPDGKFISYMRYDKNQPTALWISEPDGTNAKELLKGVTGIAEWKTK